MTAIRTSSIDLARQLERTGRFRRAVRVPKTVRTGIWVGIFLIAAETGVRIRAWIRHGSGSPVAGIYQPDSDFGRTLRPRTTLSGLDRELRINDWGFRGADITKSKPPGTVRIAAIGDSTTFGLEASNDNAVWVARVGARLSDNNPTSIQMINAAVPGYTLAVSARYLRTHVAAFDPDIVIAGAVAPDIAAHSRRQFRTSTGRQETKAPVTQFFHTHSLLLNLIRQNTAAFRAANIPSTRHDRLDEQGLVRFRDDLDNLIDTCRKNEWRLILCTTPRAFGNEHEDSGSMNLAVTALAHNPALSLAGLNDAYDRYNEVIREAAKRTNTPLMDLDRTVPRGGRYFADSVHLNDEGHALVADAISQFIARTLIPQLTTDGS